MNKKALKNFYEEIVEPGFNIRGVCKKKYLSLPIKIKLSLFNAKNHSES